MHLSLSHHLFIISNSHHQSPFFRHKSAAKHRPPPPSPPPPSSTFSPNSVPPPLLNPIQKLAAAAIDMMEKSMVTKVENKKKPNRMVDPAVQLEGNYAPVQECPVHHGIEVIGTIPSSIEGVYLRNGGNPLFTPTGGHHFFDGDGMIHAVTFAAGNRASYCCRFTRTNRLVREAALGKPVFPKPIGELHGHIGLARLALFGARSLIGLVDSGNGIGLANVALVYFNGRLLAMSEDDLPYIVRITPDGDLQTIGRYDFDGQLKDSMIAHPKVDPITGDLYSLSYNVVSKPHLKFFKIDRWGHKSRDFAISLEQPTMIHDFTMTESHVIIPDHQVTFKLSKMIQNKSPVVYDKKKVSRFGVMPKDSSNESMIQWIDVPNCFFYHIWNAWEEYNEKGHKIIVIINSCITPPEALYSGGEEPIKSELTEIRLNLKTGESIRRVIISGVNFEGGQVRKQDIGLKTRYIYMAIVDPWPKCSGLAKVDLATGNVTKYMYGEEKFGGEPCFVPSKAEENDEEEEEGFLMSFVRDEKYETSELVILKASTMEHVALLKIPTRVPYGFHGTFVTSQDLANQSSV